jgi:quinohemoprotein ethanol dehydrogenase
LFGEHCVRCHLNVVGAAAHRIGRPAAMTPAIHASFDSIVLDGLLQPRGMPRWDDVLTAQEAGAIHQYLIFLSWEA